MKKGFIKIKNKGEIDINSLLLIGATNKRGNKNAIGYFGSGLKYAMAVLLKNNIPFRIFSGEKEIKVSVGRKTFRGSKIDVIKVNGKFTSMTTDMGPDWKPWFSVREIYCNSIDEGEYSIGISNNCKGEKGKTLIFISFDENLREMFNNWNDYFSDKRKDLLLESQKTKIYSGQSDKLIIYRKGVQCYQSKEKSLFHYDLPWVKINESRVLEDMWNVTYDLAKGLAMSASLDIVKIIFDGYEDSFENKLQWSVVRIFNNNWLAAINGRKIVIDNLAGYFAEEIAKEKCLILPQDLAISLKDYYKNKVVILGRSDDSSTGTELKTTVKQALYIKESLDFLRKGGIEIDFPIIIWKFDDNSTLGQAISGKIRLSENVFDKGKRTIVAVLLEESSHIISGSSDKTRSFQDFLFNKIISLLEEKTEIRL